MMVSGKSFKRPMCRVVYQPGGFGECMYQGSLGIALRVDKDPATSLGNTDLKFGVGNEDQ